MANKILELDGLKYSRHAFEGYKFRAKVVITTVGNLHNLDIYTTDPNKDNLWGVLADRRHERVTSISIINWSTKEQDDKESEFINEILSNI